MSGKTNFIDIQLGTSPLRDGADLALALVPFLISAMRQAGYDTPQQRAQFWSGYASSMSGTLAADIGAPAAREILQFMQESVLSLVEDHTKETTH